MEVVDPVHKYILSYLDIDLDTRKRHEYPFEDTLTFVKREGEKYPGNVSNYPGTTTQEVLRALIDRIKYVDKQLLCRENKVVLDSLRQSINFLESRAHRLRGKVLLLTVDEYAKIEDIPTCDTCGHILCKEDHG